MKVFDRFPVVLPPISSWPTFTVITVLCLSVFLSYANSLRNGFVRDDHYLIEIDRDTVGVESLLKVFTGAQQLVETNPAPYYRPVNRLSYLVDKYFFGLDPAGYHAVNIALHVLCSLLVYFTVMLLGERSLLAFGTALLFGVHPVNTEAVNFIAARNDILATVFTLASLVAFLLAENHGRKAGYFLSGLLFFLGILSKESAAMLLPFLIFLKGYRKGAARSVAGGRATQTDYIFIVFHLVFLGAYIILRSAALEVSSFSAATLTGITDRLRMLFYIVPTYFGLLVAPNNMKCLYEIPAGFDGILWSLVAKWAILISVLCYVIWKRTPMGMIGLVWLLLNLLPVSNLVQLPSNSMAERYLYLPLIGVFMMFADEADGLLGRDAAGWRLFALFLALGLVLGMLSARRNLDWKDEYRLALSEVRASPSSALAHYNLGCATYLLLGDRALAEKEFTAALAIDPQFYWASWANYYLGAINVEAHNLDGAEHYFENATKRVPSFYAAHYALASLLYQRGDKEAIRQYDLMLGKLNVFSANHIVEICNRVEELDPSRKVPTGTALARRRSVTDDEAVRWRRFYAFSSGTEWYYEAQHLRRGVETSVLTMQRLSKADKRRYALRFLRYPLEATVEARITFELKCREKLYKPTYLAFRDESGAVLGQIDMEREAFLAYEYAVPGTALSALFASVCGRTQ